jgi:hypothetical protein
MVHKKMLCGKHEQSVMFRGRTIAGVLALLLAGCALAGCATLFGSPDSKAWKAIEKNDLAGLEKVLQKNANRVDLQDNLRVAIECNNLPAVKMLVKYGADVKKPVSHNTYPLYIAVSRRENPSLEMIEYLIQEGAEVTADKNNLLLLAVDKDLKLIQYLADRGADINASWDSDRTVLSLAIRANRNDVVDYLLEKGVNQASLNSALLTASDSYKYGLVRTLVEKGVDVTKNTWILERAYDADQSLYAYVRDRGAPYTPALLGRMYRDNVIRTINELNTGKEVTVYGKISTIGVLDDFININKNGSRLGITLSGVAKAYGETRSVSGADRVFHYFYWNDRFMSEFNEFKEDQYVFIKAVFGSDARIVGVTNDNRQVDRGNVLAFQNAHLAGN